MMNPNNPRMIFDLKGSRNKRYVNLPAEEKAIWKKSRNQKRVMKDLNFLEIDTYFAGKFLLINKE